MEDFERSPARAGGNSPWLLVARVVILIASLILLIIGVVGLTAQAHTTYTSTMAGSGTSASCERGFTALTGGGSASPFAYHAYDLNPAAESDPIMRGVEASVAAHASAWKQRWHQEDHACVNAIRRNFAIGSFGCLVGFALFVLRLRLPGRRRDLRDSRTADVDAVLISS